MTDTAKLILDEKTYDLPIITGSLGEKAIDISTLRASSGYVTLDPAYGNTGACTSAITFIDGDKGILKYRGYSLEELCERSSFVEVAYLLIYGSLPDASSFAQFRERIGAHALIHEDMKNFFNNYPATAHPMSILSAMTCSLSNYHPHGAECFTSGEAQDDLIAQVFSKTRALAAFTYRRYRGLPYVHPRKEFDYLENFLGMMFSSPMERYQADPVVKKAIDLLFILHADHEQNCSTSTVRLVGSSQANLFASISAGICALWGPLHGGANQEVIEMLEEIQAAGGDYKHYIARAKDKNDSFKLMGFGHRVYKNYDPRARIIKNTCDEVLAKLGINDPVLEIAKGLEEAALADEYFIERKLFPNVDFYSGIIYRALGIPTSMFTVMFALGRVPGWIAQWKEMTDDSQTRIGRPRQIYTGEPSATYKPIAERNK
jgi:citrate synthase